MSKFVIPVMGRYGFGPKPVGIGMMLNEARDKAVSQAAVLNKRLEELTEEEFEWRKEITSLEDSYLCICYGDIPKAEKDKAAQKLLDDVLAVGDIIKQIDQEVETINKTLDKLM